MIVGLFFRMQKPVMILAAMILTLIRATLTPGSTGKSESSKDDEKFIPRMMFNGGWTFPYIETWQASGEMPRV